MSLKTYWQSILLFVLSSIAYFYINVRNSQSSIHWVTFSKESHPALTKLRDMSHRFGETITVIPSQPNLNELKKMLDSNRFRAEDIVIVSDSKSIMQAASQDTIRKRFLTFRKPIVFAGKETPTNPSLAGRYGILAKFQPFPYLNSKLFIGHVGTLRTFLAFPISSEMDDETVLTNAIQKQPWLAEIDTRGELFVTHVKKSPISSLEFNTHNHRVACRGSGTQPCVIQSEESVLPFYAYFSV